MSDTDDADFNAFIDGTMIINRRHGKALWMRLALAAAEARGEKVMVITPDSLKNRKPLKGEPQQWRDDIPWT